MRSLMILLLGFFAACLAVEGEGFGDGDVIIAEGEGEGEIQPAEECGAKFLFPNVAGAGLRIFEVFAFEDATSDACINNANGFTAVGVVQATIEPPYDLGVDDEANLIQGRVAVAIEGDVGARFCDLGQIAVSASDFSSPCSGADTCIVAGAICIPPAETSVAMQLFDATGVTSNAECVAVDEF